MDELLIKQSADRLKILAPAIWITAAFFCVVSFLKSGGTIGTQLTASVSLIISLLGTWSLYVHSNRVVRIDKTRNEITVAEMTFLGKRRTKTYPLDQFAAIRSYITPGRGAMNIVELARKGGVDGLELCSFPPREPGKLWTLSAESENPKAGVLAVQVAEFLALPNLGFIGHRFPS